MVIIDNYVYSFCETGGFILCGKISYGIDGEFIEWFD
jgi:hypothetical protein